MVRNDILINGKRLSQIEDELAEPFPRGKTSYNPSGDSYFPVEAYEERLIEVLGGRRWFNVVCSPAQMYQVGGKYVVSVCVSVEILSDSNEIVWKKSSAGGSNVIIVNHTGEAKSLKSDIKSAVSEALKNVYQQFGIGIGQLRQMKKTGSKAQGRGQGQSGPGSGQAAPPEARSFQERKAAGNGRQENPKEHKISVKFLTSFNSISGGYAADVICTDTGEARKLVIFKDAVPNIEVYCTMAKFIRCYGKEKSLTFMGYENTYRGTKQFIFKQPVVKTEAAAPVYQRA